MWARLHIRFGRNLHNSPALALSPGAVPGNRVPSYTLLNLRAVYLFRRDRAELALSFYHVVNDRQREHPLGDVIGSRVTGWFTLKL